MVFGLKDTVPAPTPGELRRFIGLMAEGGHLDKPLLLIEPAGESYWVSVVLVGSATLLLLFLCGMFPLAGLVTSITLLPLLVAAWVAVARVGSARRSRITADREGIKWNQKDKLRWQATWDECLASTGAKRNFVANLSQSCFYPFASERHGYFAEFVGTHLPPEAMILRNLLSLSLNQDNRLDPIPLIFAEIIAGGLFFLICAAIAPRLGPSILADNISTAQAVARQAFTTAGFCGLLMMLFGLAQLGTYLLLRKVEIQQKRARMQFNVSAEMYFEWFTRSIRPVPIRVGATYIIDPAITKTTHIFPGLTRNLFYPLALYYGFTRGFGFVAEVMANGKFQYPRELAFAAVFLLGAYVTLAVTLRASQKEADPVILATPDGLSIISAKGNTVKLLTKPTWRAFTFQYDPRPYTTRYWRKETPVPIPTALLVEASPQPDQADQAEPTGPT